MKIYLAGSMEYASDRGAGWRSQILPILESHGMSIFDPTKEEDMSPYSGPEEYARAKTDSPYPDMIDNTFLNVTRNYITSDIKELLSSQLVFFYYDGTPIFGTSGEVTLAYHYNIPVLMAYKNVDLRQVSSWILGCVSAYRPFDVMLNDEHQLIGGMYAAIKAQENIYMRQFNLIKSLESKMDLIRRINGYPIPKN